ncbi:MAG: hypothetical protein ACAI38_00490 [Myxococcota bacterium]
MTSIPLHYVHKLDVTISRALAPGLGFDARAVSERTVDRTAADGTRHGERLHAIAEAYERERTIRAIESMGRAAIACGPMGILAAGFLVDIPLLAHAAAGAIATGIAVASSFAVRAAVNAAVSASEDECRERFRVLDMPAKAD